MAGNAWHLCTISIRGQTSWERLGALAVTRFISVQDRPCGRVVLATSSASKGRQLPMVKPFELLSGMLACA